MKMKPFEHLKEISPLFKTDYRRFGVTKNFPIAIPLSIVDRDLRNLINLLNSEISTNDLIAIHEILDRYKNGIWMSVPLDKECTEWTENYFWMSPHQWCFLCKKSLIPSDLNDNDQCSICKEIPYSIEQHKYVGFPSSKKYPHLNYLPGCFKKIIKRNKLTERQGFLPFLTH